MKFEQLVGRVYGNVHLEYPNITREMVAERLRKKLPMIEFFPIDKSKFYLEPVRGTQGSIGYDLFVSEDTFIPHSIVRTFGTVGLEGGSYNPPTLIKTNTGVVLPPGHGAWLKERSSMGKRGIACLAGVIDNDYRGELVICVVNHCDGFTVRAGERVAQLVVFPGYFADSVSVINKGERGEQGFGSTGV